MNDLSADRLAAIHARAFDGPARWSAPSFRKALADPACFFISESDAAEGFALGRVVADECELLTLVVDPEFRRRGIARTLLRCFETEARRRGATRMFLEVAADNHFALALYEGAQWSAVGRRPAYYGDVDAILMERTLRQTQQAG
ncbi:Mycothiol acetyltransferase [Jannaschia aquimarina]|uniref:[Ribosomal protein bS18]-alanine N-acetyltransferase n=2 Tax=Jannaschia aquimarina TaxID=935700 RepID=A0A0D1CSA2_9RHOB|nr:Mycothiol acetyltransferase [Jannaschia aquimarina]SNS79661.1 ribosomal-protein-alanine N-acetyltransferase [Jannaschia aquimarina]